MSAPGDDGHPRRPKRFRRIVVRDVSFSWRFRPGPYDSVLVVVGPGASGCRLVVTLRGWKDPWLSLSGFQIVDGKMQLYSSARNAPAVVAPAFVRVAIEHALDAGWNHGARAPDFALDSRDGVFSRPA
jgi:hypothetical protein